MKQGTRAGKGRLPAAHPRDGDPAILLSPVPPFDFGLSASIFARGDPDIRSYAEGTFRQLLRVEGLLVLVTVTSEGTVDRPRLRVRTEPAPLPPQVPGAAGRVVTRLFNLALDLSPFVKAVEADPVMSSLVRQLRGLKPPKTSTVFEALVDSIIEQQISLSAAHSIERRFTRAFGDTLELEGRTYFAFPSPEHLAGATVDELRGTGLSQKKAEYILGIARGVRDGTLDLEHHGPGVETGDLIRELSRLRGVGVWTAELALLRGLSRLDAIPADDLGIRRAITRYYSRESRIDTAEARRIAEAWGAWRGLAAYYLLVAERKGIGAPAPSNIHK
ncbi:MAG: DNA-3-methyladenine glycosylase [Methanomicrobiales archaeon]|nr:DNA-3-methyladenine glycosylase [Methanomicrobiales archaeon]